METTRLTARLTAAILLAAALAATSSNTASAQSNPVQLTSAGATVSHNISQSVERLDMLVKSSRILTLEARIPKFQVHNEEVLGAIPVSQNQIQIFAKTPGTTQLNLWDTDEKLYTVNVTVMADAREVEGILSSQLPFASLKVMPISNSAIVTGTVTSVDDVDRAVAIVEQFYGTVVNNIKVVGVQQVLLHTRIMEVSRTKLRDLGIDWGTFTGNSFFYNAPGRLLDASSGSVSGAAATAEGVLSTTNNVLSGSGNFTALIAALRRQDLIKFLAEPTVIATHGRPARFNVGGRVPYIVPTGNGSVSVQYEEYGTGIDFLPFVVGPGRIRLEVRPEVTEPDDSRGITAAGIQVTAFSQRYVETAVELQAGQTFAIAGLLQSRTEAVTQSTPILGEIPYFGAMFRRVKETRNDIELLITVTPELVDAMNPHQVPMGGPGLNSTSPSDCELYLNGHIEVPNMLGNEEHCTVAGDGYSTLHGQPNSFNGSGQMPTAAIIPTAEGVIVGEGVTISAPAQ
ncbi:MAG: pilus assembly protein N-terminal domain-containing protein [Rubripirellula sp.]|nr:pilus assembly protein N-terminal domain-containing protein [Rubripirellula sp.]